MNAPATANADLSAINKIALDIQDRGYRLQAVLWSIDHGVDISSTDPHVTDALARTISLCSVADDLAKAMNELACEIEAMSGRLSRMEARHG